MNINAYTSFHGCDRMTIEDAIHPEGFSVRRMTITSDGSVCSVTVHPTPGSPLDAEIRASVAAREAVQEAAA